MQSAPCQVAFGHRLLPHFGQTYMRFKSQKVFSPLTTRSLSQR